MEIGQKLEFELGSALGLSEIPGNTFDIIHAHRCVLHLSDPLTALNEFRCVRKPEGIVSTHENADINICLPGHTATRRLQVSFGHSVTQDHDLLMGRKRHAMTHAAGIAWETIQTICWTFECADPAGREA